MKNIDRSNNRSIIRYISAALLLFFFTTAGAQTPKKTQTIKESVEQFKGIFKKKESSGNSSQILPKNVKHIQGGKIATNAIYLEVDYMNDFNDGKAIVRKGSATAMIDGQGNTVVPFNTYGFIEAWNVNSGMANTDNTYSYHNHEVAGTGFFQYRASAQTGYDNYLTASAKIIQSPVGNNATFGLTPEKNYLTSKKSLNNQKDQQGNSYNTYYYQDKEGKVFVHSPLELTTIREGIGIVNYGGRKGYVALDGRKLTEIIFDKAEPFSDGMAVVGQKDQFGILKYGFIDTRGQIAIALTYSKSPTHFSCGFATVYPKDYPTKDDQLAYAFINKQGEVVRSFTVSEQKQFSFPPFQNYGLTYWNRNFMDTTFNIITKENFFARYGLTGNVFPTGGSFDHAKGQYRQYLFSVVGETNPKMYFSINGTSGIGFINLATNIVVLPTFTKLGFFDPVSGLAYAEIGQNQNATKGYINELGEWVILQSKGGMW